MDTRYWVDPEIRQAFTLPASFYRSERLFGEAKDRLFAKSWQFVGHERELAVPGTVKPMGLLPGCLDEPILLTRDSLGGLNCLSNVCSHRGNLVQTEAANCAKLRCRYHGRRFQLDGKFEFMPEFEEARGFPSCDDDLPRLALANWRGLLFAGIDPCVEFEELVREMSRVVGHLPLEEFRFAPERSRDYSVAAHWALYVDNYLEGFHVPYVHPELARGLDYANYSTEIFPFSSLQVGVARDGENVFEGTRIAAWYFWLFPNTMLNFYPWGLSVNVVEPLAVNRTRVSFKSFVWKPELLDLGAGGDLDSVELEDEQVVEQVQLGVASRMYRRGRFSPTRERAVHHFHRLLQSAMGVTAPGPDLPPAIG